jgi:membrane fusion protein (multidrug efflux system)
VIGKDGKAEQRTIDASTWYGDEWLVEEGLQPGAQVVVEGFHRVQPGIQVKAVPYRDASPSSATENGEAAEPTP